MSQSVSDDAILRTPVSERRKQAFLQSFCADRVKPGVRQMLFDRSSAFLRESRIPSPEKVPATGFNLLVHKAPFVDLSNWGANRTWDFAVAMEKPRLARFEQALRESTYGTLGRPVVRSANSVLDCLQDMAIQLDGAGYSPSLFVTTGPWGSQRHADLMKITAGTWEPQVKQALSTTFRILGMYRGIPILDIPESPEPGVYAVDLKRFALLTEYGDAPEYHLEAIDESRAVDLLKGNPELIQGSLSDAENVGELQIRVILQLFETYNLETLDESAAVGCPLVGPVLERAPERVSA